jgi:predicted RNA-binding protein with PIN domain
MSPRLKNRILIVDAYNVIGEWPRLSELFEAGQLETARDDLISELKGYAHFRGACSAGGRRCCDARNQF